jgi:hypothetical protein
VTEKGGALRGSQQKTAKRNKQTKTNKIASPNIFKHNFSCNLNN